MIQVREGNQVFWGELERIAGQASRAGLPGRIRGMIDDVLVREILSSRPTSTWASPKRMSKRGARKANTLATDWSTFC
jgi:hypothetical protein